MYIHIIPPQKSLGIVAWMYIFVCMLGFYSTCGVCIYITFNCTFHTIVVGGYSPPGDASDQEEGSDAANRKWNTYTLLPLV